MRRRKITVNDWLRGVGYSWRNGTIRNAWKTQQFINAVHDERVDNEDVTFGTGERGGDRNWTAPVHGYTLEGRAVTVSFGKGRRRGDTLVCDGHMSMRTFYNTAAPGKGHDHYLVDGSIAKDRGRFK